MNELDAIWFKAVVDKLESAGFAQDDIAWSENIQPPASPEDFAREAIFVICNSGLHNRVAQQIFERVMKALSEDIPPGNVFGHILKARAIQFIWNERLSLYANYLAAEDQLAFCESLPSIGPITKYHLAKNFGLDVAKPDRHLVRLGELSGETPQALCDRLAVATMLRSATVDVLLWRACANGIVNPRTGEVTV